MPSAKKLASMAFAPVHGGVLTSTKNYRDHTGKLVRGVEPACR